MSDHFANIVWKRGEQEAFIDKKYSRAHKWQFDGGMIVPASASPHIVPAPYSEESHVDPEEAFIASVASCHMLFFLDFAARAGYVVDQYIDHSVGKLEKNTEGKMVISEIRLRPMINFSGETLPDQEAIEKLHHQSHEQCFIANSIHTKVLVDFL